MEQLNKGFTLIEMMVVVAIIGILAALAYPSYSDYLQRTNRSEGLVLLSDVAARQERYFSQNNVYITVATEMTKLGLSSPALSATNKYQLAVAKVANDGGYSLIATPIFTDSKCGNLTLNALGKRGASEGTNEDCWR